MSKLMLIDAVHPEETRVALTNNSRVNDFDFETAGKRQLRGNIYLAKITRVEPSLQAAFVEYGGNRHGFLAFNEIHPDYYQLPKEDREALLREAAEEAALDDDDDFDLDEDDEGDASSDASDDDDTDEDDEASSSASDDDDDDSDDDTEEASADAGDGSDDSSDDADKTTKKKQPAKAQQQGKGKRRSRRPNLQKRYRIQEVIRRRQVLLVQVVKEERGNKGAALTTYLSLAGRYSVLMPNTPRGGGISRKISNGSDRKRLKEVMRELEVPQGMGLIVRTAGAKRTKTEIKRDYEYLTKLWNQICDKTMNSMAPNLIHEEGGLVHRAMRDMFDKDIEEVLIQGEAAYREAKDLAKMIMPSQAKKVKQWKEPEPVFVAEGVEEQLDQIYSPEVKMKSGGYLVINQTEALVAIDVNSGKSTRERNIEQTALRTNLEAAEEACRQMRLRDLAGLVVIDFIDMDENKNNRAVEKKLKDCLRLDRARVQHGRISQFGLMEISRQRRRAGVLQATSDPCGVCKGTGRRRSISSAALQLLRTIEARVATGGLKSLKVTAPTEVALYLLNNKREAVSEIETTAGFALSIASSDDLLPGDFEMDAERDPNAKAKPKRKRRPRTAERSDTNNENDDAESEDSSDENDGGDTPESSARSDSEDGEGKRKRRRRGRRGGRRRKKTTEISEGNPTGDDVPESPSKSPAPAPEDGGEYLDGVATSPAELLDESDTAPEEKSSTDTSEATTTDDDAKAEEKPAKPKRRRSRRKPAAKKSEPATDGADSAEASDTQTDTETAQAPSKSQSKPKKEVAAETSETAKADTPKEEPAPAEAEKQPVSEPTPAPVAAEVAEASPEKPAAPKRKGWWSR